MPQHQPIHMPTPSEQHWPAVRERLHTARGIPNRILDACKRHGILYADQRNNAVFRCTDTKRQTTGAEILGTHHPASQKAFKAMAKGSRMARGAFWIPAANQAPRIPSSSQRAPSTPSPHSLSSKPRKAQPSSHPPQAQRHAFRAGSKHGNQTASSAHSTQTPPAIRTPKPSPNAIQGSSDADPMAPETGTKSSENNREHEIPRLNHQKIREIRHP